MTLYEYYVNMQELSLRASRACEAINPSSYLSTFYEAAEEGFFRKYENLPATKALSPAGILRENRFKEFKQAVTELEEKAAYAQKEAGQCRK